MPCYHPLQAWRTTSGEVVLGKDPQTTKLRLPCGNCLGCRTERSQAWALRCHLELQEHKSAVFTTNTYDDAHLPLTLQKTHVSLWLKNMRRHTEKIGKIRFFATGEYGERTQRPHYHAIIYGLDAQKIEHHNLIQETWKDTRTGELLGHTRTEPITPARIAYTAGYCSKKIGYKRLPHERVDPQTGEVYEWQPPFILMSRNPGIGANARDKYTNAWRLYAIKDGHKMRVPRYFKEKYKATATLEELAQLEQQIAELNLRALTPQELRAAEAIAEARHKLKGENRKI